jgi:hypothetical protein
MVVLVVLACAVLIGNFITLATGGHAGVEAGLAISQPALLGIYAGVLVCLGLINTVTVRALGIVGEVSGAFGALPICMRTPGVQLCSQDQ